MNNPDEVASGAVAKALERAKRCAAVAGLAVALVPLGSLPASAAAVLRPAVSTCTSVTSNGSGGGYFILYHVTYGTSVGSGGCNFGYVSPSDVPTGPGLIGFSIPELHQGDLNFTLLRPGWATSETTSPLFAGASLNSGSAPWYINLFDTSPPASTSSAGFTTSGEIDPENNPIYTGFSGDFGAEIPTDNLIEANFGFRDTDGNVIVEDPPIPNTGPLAVVPEPSAMAVFGIGLAALVGIRRRRKR